MWGNLGTYIRLRSASLGLRSASFDPTRRPDRSNYKFLALKLLGQSGLLQNCIGSVPGFDMIVDDKSDIGNRTVPDLMIAFSLPFELAASFAQMLFQDSGVIGH